MPILSYMSYLSHVTCTLIHKVDDELVGTKWTYALSDFWQVAMLGGKCQVMTRELKCHVCLGIARWMGSHTTNSSWNNVKNPFYQRMKICVHRAFPAVSDLRWKYQNMWHFSWVWFLIDLSISFYLPSVCLAIIYISLVQLLYYIIIKLAWSIYPCVTRSHMHTVQSTLGQWLSCPDFNCFPLYITWSQTWRRDMILILPNTSVF